jgi:hypothetical protein
MFVRRRSLLDVLFPQLIISLPKSARKPKDLEITRLRDLVRQDGGKNPKCVCRVLVLNY